MVDLIDRQAAIDAIEHRLAEPEYQHMGEDWYAGMNCAEFELYDLPSAQPDVVSVVHGKWVKSGRWGRVYRCDQCGNYLDFDGVNVGRGDANYCPNCGSRNRSEE